MMTAKVFKNGRSQAIRLPKECRFSSDEVMVNKFSDDFMADGRTTDTVQERDEL